MNPFLRYLADKNSAHTQTDRQTDRHTPMITIPCGLRRAGKNAVCYRNGHDSARRYVPIIIFLLRQKAAQYSNTANTMIKEYLKIK